MQNATAAAPTLRELGYLTEQEYADFRGVKISTLRNERARRLGPPFTRFGRRVVYPLTSIRKHLAVTTVATDTSSTLGGRRQTRRLAK